MAIAPSSAKANNTIYSLTGSIKDLRPGARKTDRLFGTFAFRTAAGVERSVMLLVPPKYLAALGDRLKMASGRGPTRLRGFFTELPASGRLPKRSAFVPFLVVSASEMPMTSTPPADAPVEPLRSLAHQHTRVGFWRRQRYGKGRALTRLVYIESLTVRADRPKKH